MYTPRLHDKIIVMMLILASCKLEGPEVGTTSLYVRGDECEKLALDINELTTTTPGGTPVNAVDAAYIQRIAQTGAQTLRIDATREMFDANDDGVPESGVITSMAAELGRSSRAVFTLSIGDDVVNITGQGLEKRKSTCENPDLPDDENCIPQREAIREYFIAFDHVVTSFLCARLNVTAIEVFPHPNSSLPETTLERIHPDWFAEILTQAAERMTDPAKIPARPADCGIPEEGENGWQTKWLTMSLVSGSLDASDLVSVNDLEDYIDGIEQGLSRVPDERRNLLDTMLIGLNVRDVEPVFDPVSGIFARVDTVRSKFGSFGLVGQIDVVFGWTGKRPDELALLLDTAMGTPVGVDPPQPVIGFERHPHIRRAYFLSLHSSNDADSTAQDGVFTQDDAGDFIRVLDVGDKLQERACLNYIDYVAVFDTTGSMGDDIVDAQTAVVDLVNTVIFRDPLLDPQFAVVEYRDFVDSSVCRVNLDLTRDQAAAIATIEAIRVGGGGDAPEAVYSGLMTALHNPEHRTLLNDVAAPGRDDCAGPNSQTLSRFRPFSNRVVILVGDAPPKDPEPHTGYDLQAVLGAAHCPFDDLNPILDPEACAPGEIPSPASLGQRIASLGPSSPARIFPIQVDACDALGNCLAPIPEFQTLAEATGGRLVLGGVDDNLVDLIGDVVNELVAPPPNAPPRIEGAVPSLKALWPPNHALMKVAIEGVSDPEGGPVTIKITGVTQDEPVNERNMEEESPDAFGLGGSTARLRAERAGNGNGRVYRVKFVARDERGAAAIGSVDVCVPHDAADTACVDDGQDYNSMFPQDPGTPSTAFQERESSGIR